MEMELIKIRDLDGTMLLSDRQGNTAEFEFVELYARDGAEYAVLLQSGDDMVTILRFEENGPDGIEHYYTVEDDALFDDLYAAFAADHADEFDFLE